MAANFPQSDNRTSVRNHILCCYTSKDGVAKFTIFAATKCFLTFPPCVFILHMALQKWWWQQQQHCSSAAAVRSTADVLTYHIVAMTLFGIFGTLAICCGIHVINYSVITLGFCCWSFAWYGEISFHTLTCMDRYLAIVHPIKYLKLKRGGGVFIRNISIVCAWLFCTFKTVMNESLKTPLALLAFDHTLVLLIASFCSFSVFCVLVRPTPGKQKRDGNDRTKQRAFVIIMTSLWILILRICWNFVVFIFVLSPERLECATIYLGIWVTSLSSLVTPLLFLNRAGKFTCWKKAT